MCVCDCVRCGGHGPESWMHDGVNKHFIDTIAVRGPRSVDEYMSRCHTFASLRMMNLSFIFFRCFVFHLNSFVHYIWCVCCAFVRVADITDGMDAARVWARDQKWWLLIHFPYIGDRDRRTRALFIVRGIFHNPYCFNWTAAVVARSSTTNDQFVSIVHHRNRMR